MSRYRSILSHFVFFLQLLLVLLVLFRDRMEVPGWLQLSGRLHPLLIHFPIALLLLLLVAGMLRNRWQEIPAVTSTFDMLMLHAAAFATLTALSGLFLSTDGGYDPVILDRHLWLGTATAVGSYLVWKLTGHPGVSQGLLSTCLSVVGITLVVGSHYGGSLTHGSDYLSFSRGDQSEEKIATAPAFTDSSAVFAAAVMPILQSKCQGCHNEEKAKGGLVMTGFAALEKGGKNGRLWEQGNPDSSLMIKRILMSVEEEKHMPPKGKPQLTPREIDLLHRWIARGADPGKTFAQYPVDDSFRIIATGFRDAGRKLSPVDKSYGFKAADAGLVARLNGPYRLIEPVDRSSPALRVSFHVSARYRPEALTELTDIREQIVSLNLLNMPAGDEAMDAIARMPNLERLNLTGTQVKGERFGDLSGLRMLREISLSNTKVSAAGLEALGDAPALEKVYLWKTPLTATEITGLSRRFPKISWDQGYHPDSTERLKLTLPQALDRERMVLGKDEGFALRHPMPGVSIRYTLDGSEPDSNSAPFYKDPIRVSGPTFIRARAVLNGWYASDIAEFTVFSRGIVPDGVELLTQTDKRYRAQGAVSLTDGNKGESNNNLVNWLGFREVPFVGRFHFAGGKGLKRVILSMADNNGGYIMPPAEVMVHGGDDSSRLEPVGRLVPVQPENYGPVRNRFYTVDIRPGNYRYLRLEARPVEKLPEWHRGKGAKGWVFVDEVFFE